MRALQAHTLGLMDAEGLQHVVLEAAQDLRRARARYAFDPVDWAKCVRQLNKDIRAANDFLPDNLQVRSRRLFIQKVPFCVVGNHATALVGANCEAGAQAINFLV